LLFQVFVVSSVCCFKCLLFQVFVVSSVCCFKCLLFQVFVELTTRADPFKARHELGIQKKKLETAISSRFSVVKTLRYTKETLFWSKITNCSRTPLIAKWYLGGPLTKSFMTRWSMDDVSLPGIRVSFATLDWEPQTAELRVCGFKRCVENIRWFGKYKMVSWRDSERDRLVGRD